MKGIILAGDSGTNLYPLTKGIPKQLLPIYDKPMIYYPIQTLVDANIRDILIITTRAHQPLFKSVLGKGEFFDARFDYAVQEEPNGIAQAITIAKDFIEADNFCLVTGDTIIVGPSMTKNLEKAFRSVCKSGNATIFIEDKTYPNQYGKVVLNNEGKTIEIVGDEGINYYYSISSIYIFPNNAVNRVNEINFSERGRKEITDLNKLFFKESKLQVRLLDKNCKWFDTNTFDNLLKCSEYMSKIKKQNI